MKKNAIFIIALLAMLSVQMPTVHAQTAVTSAMLVTSTNSTQINGIVQRAFGIVAGIAGLVIAILWVPIAIGYFSRDLDRKADAKERTKDALIGTLIFVMAISGVLYAVIHYIVVG